MLKFLLAWIALPPIAALAQDTSTRFYTSGTVPVVRWTQPRAMATVSPEGAIKIDWDEVARVLADPNADRQTLAYARLIQAVRQGTWHPIEHAQ